ncbi:MAG: hypothetical protein V1698_00095 [bacterium]
MDSTSQTIKNLSEVDSQRYLDEAPAKFFAMMEKFFHSDFFNKFVFYCRTFFIILTIILVIALVLLLLESKPIKRWKTFLTGTEVKKIPKTRLKFLWNKAQRRLAIRNESDYKMAVIEADKILDKLLQAMGYKGESLGERLKVLTPSQIKNIDGIWNAHRLRNRIVHNPDEKITLDEAEKAMEEYGKVLEELGVV